MAGFLSRLLPALGGQKGAVSYSAAPPPGGRSAWKAFWAERGLDHYTSAGEIVNAGTARGLDIVQACLEQFGSTIKTLPVVVGSRSRDSKKAEPDHYLSRLLRRRPNPRQTAAEFWDEQARHLAFERNCYSRIITGENGVPEALEIIHPHRVNKIEVVGNVMVYEIAGLGNAPASRHTATDIWHVRRAPLDVDGLRGEPVYRSAPEAFGRALAVENYGARFFRNSGKSGGILKHPGTFKSAQDRQDFIEAWRGAGTGENVHRDRLLTHGADYVAIGAMNDEAQFIETVQHVETKICGLFSMPPHRVSRLARATNNNIEHQSIEFVTHTIGPIVEEFEQSAENNLLVSEDDAAAGIFIDFDVSSLLQGDALAQARAHAIGRQWGWWSVNDIRRMRHLDPIGPAGDAYMQPLNMVDVAKSDAGEDDNV